MNTIKQLKTGAIFLAGAIIATCVLLASCATLGNGKLDLPMQIGIGYKIGQGATLTLTPTPSEPSGYKLDLVGDVKGVTQTASGWQYTSSDGLTYNVDTTKSPPLLTIVGDPQEIGDTGVIILPPPASSK